MKNKTQSEQFRWMVFLSVIAIITIGGYFVLYPQKLFKPGEKMFDLGYNLGLAGGVMLLLLLLYPLRKRVRYFANMGPLAIWFKWHMVLGILGPLTIIFHSTYHFYIPYIHPSGSPNAAVAMFSMLLVSTSGVVGRFFYTKIHHSLYGRQASLSELQANLESPGDVKSVFNFAPGIDNALEEFRIRAEVYAKQSGAGYANFFAVGIQTMMLSWLLSREVRQLMHSQDVQNKLSADQLANVEGLIRDYQTRIDSYLKAVRDVSQFSSYERMFSWWHVFHIPLVYMMVFSALYHVYAVHAF